MRLILALALTIGVNYAVPTITSACEEHNLKGLSPTDTYHKYHSIVEHARALSEIVPYWSQEAAKEYETKKLTEERAKEALSTFQKMLPEKLNVVAEKIEGNDATLSIESHEITPLDKEKLGELVKLAKASDASVKFDDKRVYKSTIKGKIAMRLENGVWKVHRENFSSEFEADPIKESEIEKKEAKKS